MWSNAQYHARNAHNRFSQIHWDISMNTSMQYSSQIQDKLVFNLNLTL